MLGHVHQQENSNDVNIKVLRDYLASVYPLSHPLTLYEAAQYPGMQAKIQPCTLAELEQATLSSITTLYIPPAKQKPRDEAMLQALGIHLD